MARNKLKQFTERAMEAVDAGKFLPPIVYLPRKMRANGLRLTVDNIRITTDPPTVAENHLRIADADPIGFLLAIMHGQPIPAFHIEKDGSLRISYHVYSEDDRKDVAKWLANKVTIRTRDEHDGKGTGNTDEWDAIVARREGTKRNA